LASNPSVSHSRSLIRHTFAAASVICLTERARPM
jgi:hypothetical protein